MRIISKKLTSYMMAAVLAMASLGVPVSASAASSYGYYVSDDSRPTGGKMLADVVMVRPFMLVSTVLTTATFIVTLPLSALGGNVGESAEKLVKEPAAYTFTRPLGDI